jgi:hypothetical protein
MRELLPELAEPLLVLLYGAIVTALTAVGMGAELTGLAGVAGGADAQSLWLVYLGAVGIAAAVVVARRRLVPQIAAAF